MNSIWNADKIFATFKLKKHAQLGIQVMRVVFLWLFPLKRASMDVLYIPQTLDIF